MCSKIWSKTLIYKDLRRWVWKKKIYNFGAIAHEVKIDAKKDTVKKMEMSHATKRKAQRIPT